MILIDGKKAAAELREELKKEVAKLKAKHNKVPGLTVILIGDLSYYRQFNFVIAKSIEFPLPTNPERTLIKSLNDFDISLIKGKVERWSV